MIHLIPVIAGTVAVGIVGALVRFALKKPTTLSSTPNLPLGGVGAKSKSGITGALTSVPQNLVPVKLGDETWLVAPDYIGPIGINEAANMAKDLGMELPSPALVDAIWRQADLKLLPMPRQNVISQVVFDDQKLRIENQIAGRPFTLLGGTFKDVVMFGGKPQIYGWHVEDGKTVAGVPLNKPFTAGPGKVIQPLSGSRHDQPGPIGFKDYSQGARLVRRA